MVLEKEENMSYRNLHSPLKFEGKDWETKDDAEEDEKEDLSDEAQVERQQTQRKDVVQCNTIEEGENPKWEEFSSVSLSFQEHLSVRCLVLASLGV
jgi:hypothetical protein